MVRENTRRCGYGEAIRKRITWTYEDSLNRLNDVRLYFRRTAKFCAIGDSHVRVLRGHYPFKVYSMRGPTAYNLMNSNSTTGSLDYLIDSLVHTRYRDSIILSFGEVDCRCHIHKIHSKLGASYCDAIKPTIDRYATVIKWLKHIRPNLYILAVPPPGSGGEKYVGTQQERAEIAKEFNKQLKSMCEELGCKFIDISKNVADDNYFVKIKYCNDGYHLNRKTFKFYKGAILNEQF